MKTYFKKFNQNDAVYELKRPTTFSEKKKGVFGFSFIGRNCAIIYKTPCILHTFGLKSNLWMLKLNKNFNPVSQPIACPENSIFISSGCSEWIAEFVQKPEITLASDDSSYSSDLVITLPLTKKGVRFSNSKVKYAIVLLSLLLTFLISSVAIAAKGPIKLPVGENKEVQLDQSPRSLDISQPDIIDVQRIGDTSKILVTGLRSGISKLSARFHDGSTRDWIFQVGLQDAFHEAPASLSSGSLVRLARELQKRGGFETVIDNGRIVIFGLLNNDAQFKALVDACLGRDECLPRYNQSEDASKIQRKFFETLFHKSRRKGLELEIIPGGLSISGSVANEETLNLTKLQLRSVLSRLVENIQIDKSDATLIEAQFTFFRINTSQLDKIGISPVSKNSNQGSELAHAGFSDFMRTFKLGPRMGIRFPDLVFEALAHKGVLKQLAQPTIVVSNGGKGEVQTGGEWLFQTQGEHQKFFSQNYGLTVSVQPNIIGRDIINEKIEIRISSPNTEVNANAVSNLEQSVLSTEISTRANEHIFLTRINQSTKAKSVSKVPILGHIPILGEIFKSRESHDSGTELWIAVRNKIGLPEQPPFVEVKGNPTNEQPEQHWLD